MVEYLIQVSVMSITCKVKVSVIQHVHQAPLEIPFSVVLLQFPPTFHHWISSCPEHCFLSPVARIVDMNKHITVAIMTLHADMPFKTWQGLEY